MTTRIEIDERQWIELDASPPAGNQPWVVFMHGLASRRDGAKGTFFSEALTERGFGFVRFDFRGHGESSGRMHDLTLTSMIEDIGLVIDLLRHGLIAEPARRLILVGSSVGALVSSWYSIDAPKNVLGQVLVAPAFELIEKYVESLDESALARWQKEGAHALVGPWGQFDLSWESILDAETYEQSELSRRTDRPTLIIHGTQDETAPHDASLRFIGSCAAPRPELLSIPGGDHYLAQELDLVTEAIIAFAHTVSA